MNTARRKQIDQAKQNIDRLVELAEDIRTDLETIRDDEQEYLDNMPESLQAGDKGEKAEAAISALEDVINELDSLIGNDFHGSLDTASE